MKRGPIFFLSGKFKGLGAHSVRIISLFMPPTLKKLKGHIGLGLSMRAVSECSQSVCDA